MQDRGLAAYIAELIGTLLLVFFVTSVVTLYVSSGQNAQFGSDFAVVGLVHAFVLFGLIITFGAVSGGHFNPAVTTAAAAMRKIEPVDAIVYILAQLSGGVLGALLTKAVLLDEGRSGDYGAAKVSSLLGGPAQAALVEGIGAFVLILVIVAVLMSGKGPKQWEPLAAGTTLGFAVMVLGPLTGGSFNPARWFGPALVSNSFTDAWPYIVGPIAGALVAVAVYRFVLAGGAAAPSPAPSGGAAPSTPPKPPSPPAAS